MAESLGVEGSDEELISMFGAGWWKHDEEAATKLLEKAGLEKVNGVWNYEGKPFTFEMSYLADTEFQAARGVQAAYNQLVRDDTDFVFQMTGFCQTTCIVCDWSESIDGYRCAYEREHTQCRNCYSISSADFSGDKQGNTDDEDRQ